MASVAQAYAAELKTRGYQSDPAQLRAVQALDRCAREWANYKEKRSNRLKKLINHPDIPRGVYMYGGVGRGKSFLMDCFFQAVPLQRKTRLHFHEFMREVHRELRDLQGTVNPLDALGQKMAQRYQLICFDEFHVADITDAMILHRLLQSLFDHGVGFVTTSNFKPDGLYPDGLHRFWWTESGELGNALTYGGHDFTAYPMPIYGTVFRRLLAYGLGFAFVAYYPALALLDRTDPLGAPAGLGLGRLLVLGHDVDLRDQHAVVVGEHAQDLAGLALVAAREDLHGVLLLDHQLHVRSLPAPRR